MKNACEIMEPVAIGSIVKFVDNDKIKAESESISGSCT